MFTVRVYLITYCTFMLVIICEFLGWPGTSGVRCRMYKSSYRCGCLTSGRGKVKTRALVVPHCNSLKKDNVIGTLTDLQK